MELRIEVKAPTTLNEARELFGPVVEWLMIAHAEALKRLMEAHEAKNTVKIDHATEDVEKSMEAQMSLIGIELWILTRGVKS